MTETILHSEWNKAYSDTSTLNDCMMMDKVQSDVINQLIDSYIKQNNPSPYTDSYYPQYHVVDFVVFNVKAGKAFESIKSHLTNNRALDNKYTHHYSYKLTRRRECINSYSSIIQLIFTYPRRQSKAAKGDESVYSFLQASRISDKCRDDWVSYITACRPYDYLSKAEFLKLLNTHSDGCFVSTEEYNRFCAVADEWQQGIADVTYPTLTKVGAGDTGLSDDDDEFIPPRRSFTTPHPGIGLKVSAAGDGKQVANNDCGDSTNASTDIISSKDAATAKKKLHKYYVSTGFMQHSICGLHKWTTVAKDIHKSTNTLMYHKKVYDTRHIRSESFMMTHNPGKDPNTSQKPSSSRKDGDKSKPKKCCRDKSPPPQKKRKHTTLKRKREITDDDDTEAQSSSSSSSSSSTEDEDYVPPSPLLQQEQH